jgi:hypothetical protein
MKRQFKYSGRIAPGSLLHSMKEEAPKEALIAPKYIDTAWGKVPQYADIVVENACGFDPSGDCKSYFMSSKHQVNNNCYAYACNIASNSYPQPGRCSGATNHKKEFTAEAVMKDAVSDGLIYVGNTLADIKAHSEKNIPGHYVALLFSVPENNIGGDPNANWAGDYHWVRCDDNVNYKSWSQKDGGDQVTNFDFAGKPINNPAEANWQVNQGPVADLNEFIVSYEFYCFMFVPHGKVNII